MFIINYYNRTLNKMASQNIKPCQYIKRENDGLSIKDVNLLRDECNISRSSSVRIGRPGVTSRYILNETVEALVRFYIDKTHINISDYLVGRLFLNIIETPEDDIKACFGLCPAIYMFFNSCEIKVGKENINVNSGDIVVVIDERIKLQKCESYPLEFICFPLTHKDLLSSHIESPLYEEKSINSVDNYTCGETSSEANTSEANTSESNNDSSSGGMSKHRQLINDVLLTLLKDNDGDLYNQLIETLKIKDDTEMLNELLNVIKYFINGTSEYYSIRSIIYNLAEVMKVDIIDRKIADTFDIINNIKKEPILQLIENINEEFIKQAKEYPHVEEFTYPITNYCANIKVLDQIISRYNKYGTMVMTRKAVFSVVVVFTPSNSSDIKSSKGKEKEL